MKTTTNGHFPKRNPISLASVVLLLQLEQPDCCICGGILPADGFRVQQLSHHLHRHWQPWSLITVLLRSQVRQAPGSACTWAQTQLAMSHHESSSMKALVCGTGEYGNHTGTSQSAAFVAGAAVLLLSVYQQAGRNISTMGTTIRQDLIGSSSDPLPDFGQLCISGVLSSKGQN